MPITRKQFELGIDDVVEAWMRKVHAVLSEDRNSAFTQSELRKALARDLGEFYNVSPEMALKLYRPEEPLILALEKLVALGSADARVVRGKKYYAFLSDLDAV